MNALRGFGTLTWEAIQDAVRRRIVFAIAAMGILSMMVVDSCSSCSTGSLTVNEEAQDLIEVAGYTASITFTTLGLWIVTLAGVLGADHLTQTLEDGTAPLCLARPVSREVFALSRLCGTLGIVAITGLVLLGGTAFLFATRNGLPLGPAVEATAACGLGALAVGALAMTASLFLPRLATWLLVVSLVGVIALAGGFSAAPLEQEGWLSWVGRFGPPLASSMAAALGPWMDEITLPWGPFELWPRLLAWDVVALAGLTWAFRRREIAT
ncbi:MAG: hypothetical protein CL910_05440 [Deltaproteobacteria bacterium]|nr:hypothetical protein [Deltaproteobacteria bacterium]